ncbi:hypothetical protein O6H91_13G025600 [Diphasiastrum complanatum]|uniref:Uncharacterized protein n=1 Tax=Diphasiastrum complanatum TaxID=34168 RepID=A0ACC2BT00_DIPCM|nr:hypothetical protein O6H91_13G025600 [Diphasiastrum complanatum]
MAGLISRTLTAPMLFLNFVLYIFILGFASWALNREFENQGVAGNIVTNDLTRFALVAGVVGIASILAGLHHLKSWSTDSHASASSSALIALLLTFLAFGVTCKEIHVGGPRSKRLKTLEAFLIITAFTQLLFVLMLHAESFSNRFRPGYNNGVTGPTNLNEPGHKHTHGAAVV